jgi:hypothetical protein
MTLNASGRLLLGTTTDDGSTRLQVSGNASFASSVSAANFFSIGSVSDSWASSSAEGLAIRGTSSSNSISTITTYLDSSSLRIGSGISQKTGLFINGQTATGGSYVSFTTGGSERLRITSTGNMGLGVVPSAWSGFTTLELQGGFIGGGGTTYFEVGQNAFYDGSFKYKATGAATVYEQITGSHRWVTAPSGTAGNAISFTQVMTLFNTGNLALNTTTDAGFRLDVNGTARVSGQLTANSFVPTSSTIPTNGMYLSGTNTLGFATNGTLDMTLDANGNLGLGVTPSASSYKNIQNGYAVMMGLSADFAAYWNANAVYDGAWKYIGTSFSSRYEQSGGAHYWFNAPSGTAGNAITFTQAMTLDASGNLMVGGTSVYGATITSYASATRSGGIGIRNSAGTVAGFFGTYAAGSGSGSTDILAESAGFMAFSSGGSERLRITSAGNVGIGTAIPIYTFHTVSANTSIGAFKNNGAANGQLLIGNTVGDLALRILASGDALIFSDTSKYLAFGSNGGSERMRITSGGNLLVGTTTDSGEKLQVNGNAILTTGYKIFGNSPSGTTSSFISLYNATDGGIDLMANFTTSKITFGTAGNERMRITSGGNVGIGTTSPQAKLTVKGPSDYNLNLGTLGGYSGIYVYNDASSAYKELRIDAAPLILQSFSAGNVGIGTINPNAKLDIAAGAAAGSSDLLILSRNAGYGSTTFTQIYDNTYFAAGKTLTLKNDSGTAFAHFAGNNAGTQTNFLLPSGNVGIGVTPSAWSITPALQVVRASIYNQGDDGTYITSNGYYNASWKYIGASTATQYQMLSGQHRWLTAPSGSANAAITFTQAMTLNASGNLSIGNTNDTYKLDVSGTGRFSGQLTASTTVGGTSAIFQNTGAQNSNGIELRGGTSGTAVNWKIEKDNTVGNAFQITPSTANGGTTYTTPVLTIASTGAATFSSSVSAVGLASTGTNHIYNSNELRLYNSNNTNWGTIKGSTDSTNGTISFTGGTGNGMFINNAGNVGIGTTSPSAKLHIGESGAAAQLWLQRTDGYNPIKLIGGTLADGNGFKITMNTTDAFAITSGGNVLVGTTTNYNQKLTVNGTYTRMHSIAEDNTNAGVFYQVKNGASTVGQSSQLVDNAGNYIITTGTSSESERMRITSSGNVSIGNTNDTYKLDVSNGSSNVYIRAITSGSANWATLLLQNGDGSWHVTNDDTGTFNIGTSNDPSAQQKLTIASTGAATFSSSVTAGTGQGFMNLSYQSGYNRIWSFGSGSEPYGMGYYQGSGAPGGSDCIGLHFGNTASPLFYFNNFGQATFSSSLTATDLIGVDTLNITANNVNTNGTVLTLNSKGTVGVMAFQTASTERMRITSGGNVGIGTTSPGTKLQVNSTAGTYGITNTNGTVTIGTYIEASNTYASFGTSSNHPIGFFTNNNAPQMYINTSGNVGIGTTAPNSLLEVNRTITFSSIDTYAQLVVKTTSGANGKLLNIGVDETNGVSFIQSLNRGTDAMPLSLQRYGGNVGINTASPVYTLEVNNSTGDDHIAAVGTAPSLQLMSANTGPANWATIGMATASNQFIVGAAAGDLAFINRGTTAGNMLFGFSSSEKMRLTSNGDLCINATATTASAKLYVNGTAAFGSVYVASLGTGTVYSNAGTLTNTNPSDRRLKTNIIPLTYGLSDILKLNPVSYNWKDGTNGKQFGFIAQEVQEVMPDAVKNGEYLGLEKDAIYSALVNAIKEQQAQINELKSQLNK